AIVVPAESVTVPLIVPVSPPCARRANGDASSTTAHAAPAVVRHHVERVITDIWTLRAGSVRATLRASLYGELARCWHRVVRASNRYPRAEVPMRTLIRIA